MSNPVAVVAGTDVEASWGNAVRSRVVGIYADLSAAETDGVTEAGRLAVLTDGSVWVKVTATSGDWARLTPIVKRDDMADVTPAASSWTQYGATLTLPAGTNRLMWIEAHFQARIVPGTAADVQWRIAVSHDGGTSWVNSHVMRYDSVPTDYLPIAQSHAKSATPTGDIQVKVEVNSTQADTLFEQGNLFAKVHPDLP